MPRGKKVKIENTIEKTKSGILVPKTQVKEKQPFFVKELSKNEFAVVDGNGNTQRVYIKEPGCEDPKDSAESYARKLSQRWITK